MKIKGRKIFFNKLFIATQLSLCHSLVRSELHSAREIFYLGHRKINSIQTFKRLIIEYRLNYFVDRFYCCPVHHSRHADSFHTERT